LEANQKPADYEQIKKDLESANSTIGEDKENIKKLNEKTEQLTKENKDLNDKLILKEQELKKLQEQPPQPQPSPQGDQYLNKLLTIYTSEIKKRTELFYQDFSIDNNRINAKYGSPSISYIELLKNLKGESEIDNVINSFKVVALIIATERSQEESDKLSKLSKVPPTLKKNKLEYFQKVKED
jgi:hypothetical protein